MLVKVILHSTLRDKLPAQAHGRTDLDLPEGSTVTDVVKRLELPQNLAFAVNGMIERDFLHRLQDGDELRFFRPGAGG
jgi:sulfur carrier protein ThiS